MRSFHEGQLVTLVVEGGTLDGIVVHAPSLVKIEVAVPDPEHGPVFRTAHPKTLRERATAGEHDGTLRRLIRRTAVRGSRRPAQRTRSRTRAPRSRAGVRAPHHRQVANCALATSEPKRTDLRRAP